MLLADYASDSDSDSGSAPPAKPVTAPFKASAAAAAAPSKTKKRGPVKITLDRPKPAAGDDDVNDPATHRDPEEGIDEREAKRPKLAGLKGKGG